MNTHSELGKIQTTATAYSQHFTNATPFDGNRIFFRQSDLKYTFLVSRPFRILDKAFNLNVLTFSAGMGFRWNFYGATWKYYFFHIMQFNGVYELRRVKTTQNSFTLKLKMHF